MSSILIVDDQPAVRTALEVLLDLHGLETLSAATPEAALQLIAEEDVGVVLQDMNFAAATTSGEEGARLLSEVHALDPDLPVILMTAWASLEMAVQLVKEGASDYIAKPWDDDRLVTTVKNLLRLREVQQENTRLRARSAQARAALARRFDLRGVLYASPQMHEVVSLVARVAPADVPVLLTGPNGAGKEQLAEMVQANSRRKDGPFVKVNCGGLPDTLLEAELFGAEAGAFTGAAKSRPGRFEEAHGGTLFLDEIGTLSLSGQAKLLRVLQTGEFQRLGSNVTRKADVRVVSATNVDLPKAIRASEFREDLYFRLAVIEIQIPALRERVEDVPLLAEHFLNSFAEGAPLRFGAAAAAALQAHDWPGNVRELRNRVQRAVLVRGGEELRPVDFGLPEAGDPMQASGTETVHAPVEAAPESSDGERRELEEALTVAGGVVSRAAAQLGISRQAFYRRMERLGISVERRLRA